MCHDTYFQKEIFGYKDFTINDLVENLSKFVDIDSITDSDISTNEENLRYFMDKGLSKNDA